MSIVCIVPFDLDSIDTKKDGDVSLLQRLVNQSLECMENSGPNRDAACLVMGKLLTRPDVVKMGYLDNFIKETNEKYVKNLEDTSKVFTLVGCMTVLCEIFRSGTRAELITRVDTVFDTFITKKSGQKFI